MTDDEKQNAVEALLASLAQLDDLERKWLSLTPEQRESMPPELVRFFVNLKQ